MYFHKLIVFLFVFSSTLCTAQKVEETTDKAQQKTEDRLDRKIDKGIDNGLDAIEGLFGKKKKKKKEDSTSEETEIQEKEASNADVDAQTAAMMKMMGGGSDVEVQDSYEFENRFVILIEQFNKKGKAGETTEMTMFTTEGSSTMGMKTNMEGSDADIIYDMENYEIISLINTEGQKIGTSMSLDKEQIEQSIQAASGKEGEMPSFVKTGNSKVISGYNCDEYKMEAKNSEESVNAICWITTEAESDWMQSMSGMAGANKSFPTFQQMGYPEDGSVIQMINEDEKGEKVIMTVQEMEIGGSFSISTKGYTFMNFGGM